MEIYEVLQVVVAYMYMALVGVARVALMTPNQLGQAIEITNPFTDNVWNLAMIKPDGILKAILDFSNLIGLPFGNMPLFVIILMAVAITWLSVWIINVLKDMLGL